MILHYAEDPAGALTEATRVLAPDGVLIVVDLADHDRGDLTARLAHRWFGFADAAMRALLIGADLLPGRPVAIPGPLEIRLWTARRPAAAEPAFSLERLA
jgi:ArsR family transcriptional regulator